MASLQSPSTRPLLQPSFDEFALQLLEEWKVPGLALGIIKIGEPGQDTRVEFRNYGTAGRGRNVDEDVRCSRERQGRQAHNLLARRCSALLPIQR